MTRIQLRNDAASKLISEAGQSLEAEDGALIDAKIDPLLAQLRSDTICDVTDDANIPLEWFDALSTLLANLCAPDFYKSFDPDIKEFSEKALKKLNASRPTREVLKVDYY